MPNTQYRPFYSTPKNSTLGFYDQTYNTSRDHLKELEDLKKTVEKTVEKPPLETK